MTPSAGFALTAKAERLQQVAGVGRVSALTVLALLPERGKPAKLALTAVIRKLVILMNRLLKNPHFTLVS